MEKTIFCLSCFKGFSDTPDVNQQICETCFKELRERALRNDPIPSACEECGKTVERKRLTLPDQSQQFVWLCFECWRNHFVRRVDQIRASLF